GLVAHQLVQELDRPALGQRHPFAQLDRSGLVGDAEGEQLAHVPRSRRSASSFSSSNSRSMRESLEAMIATYTRIRPTKTTYAPATYLPASSRGRAGIGQCVSGRA